MAYVSRPWPNHPIHPLHAILLSFVFPMFLGTLLGDIAYWKTYEIAWSNLAQWLNAGGMLVGGFALLWALVDAIRFRRVQNGRRWFYTLALAAALVTGLVNAFVHTRDAWGIMPGALWWSAVSTVLALVASWLGFARPRTVEVF